MSCCCFLVCGCSNVYRPQVSFLRYLKISTLYLDEIQSVHKTPTLSSVQYKTGQPKLSCSQYLWAQWPLVVSSTGSWLPPCGQPPQWRRNAFHPAAPGLTSAGHRCGSDSLTAQLQKPGVSAPFLAGWRGPVVQMAEAQRIRNSGFNIWMYKCISRWTHLKTRITYCLINYLVSLICGSLHLLVDPALELIRVPKELLQVEGILQSRPTRLSTLMQGVAAAKQLWMFKIKEDVLLFKFTLGEIQNCQLL